MFGKLLKHDLKATGRVLPIVMGAVLLLVLLSFALYWLVGHVPFLSGLLIFLLIVCLSAVPILTFLFLTLHFYKTSYGAAAYLTRTLPVSQKAVYTSKFLTAILWILLVLILEALLLVGLVVLFWGIGFGEGSGSSSALSSLLDHLFSSVPSSARLSWSCFVAGSILLYSIFPVIVMHFCCCLGNLRPFRRIGRGAPFLVYGIYSVVKQVVLAFVTQVPLRFGIDVNGRLYLSSDVPDTLGFSFPLLVPALTLFFLVLGFFLCRRWYARSINLR